jgi:hypothetical protein
MSAPVVPTLKPESQEEIEAHALPALEFYERELRTELERQHWGKAVAIHLESRDYEVAQTATRAYRTLRQRRPQGWITTLAIGAERPNPALERRLGPLHRPERP